MLGRPLECARCYNRRNSGPRSLAHYVDSVQTDRRRLEYEAQVLRRVRCARARYTFGERLPSNSAHAYDVAAAWFAEYDPEPSRRIRKGSARSAVVDWSNDDVSGWNRLIGIINNNAGNDVGWRLGIGRRRHNRGCKYRYCVPPQRTSEPRQRSRALLEV